jgi:hypothetical protein
MIDKQEAGLMANAMGLEKPRWVEDPYRNRFHANPSGEDDKIWSKLVARGFAELAGTPTEHMPYNTYAVTDDGKRALGVFGMKDGAGDPIIAHATYVIEDATCRGDCALFWGPNRRGYTTNLGTAGRYTGVEAAQITTISSDRQDIPWKLEAVDSIARKHVSRDDLATRRPRRKS